jgi:polar amino acid transport system substrate-binding protein
VTDSTPAAPAGADVLRDLAANGCVRAAINFGNVVLAQKDARTGEARGVSVALARELARRLDVPVELVTFDAAGKVFEGLKTNAWDVAFLAIDPLRAEEIAFTSPYVVIEATYLVREDSPLRSVDDVDRQGNRIAIGRNSAYDLYLTRTIKHAEIVRRPTGGEALDMFLNEGLEAAAGVKEALVQFAQTHARLRVMPGRFMAIEQAMGTPRSRSAGAAYLRSFIDDVKASGFVARALEA